MSFSVGDRFLVGINLGWFEDKYGYDLGRSEFSDDPLWTYPPTAPITANLAVPSIPQGPPYLSQHPEAIENYFAKVNGVNIVRLWLFEKILDWYYICSPPVAEAMNRDKNLKRVIKYMIVYPIVLSLKILVRLLGNELKD